MKINDQEFTGTIRIVIDRKHYEVSEQALCQAILKLTSLSTVDENRQIKTELRRISFKRFWDQYGRKENREKAWKAWLKLTDDEIKEISRTLPYFIKKHFDVKYRPMPVTYLNQRRWEDEIIQVPVKPAVPAWVQENDYKMQAA